MLVMLALLLAASPGEVPPQYEGYKLVWHDEFDKPGLPDPSNWRFENGFVRNRELQWYQASNAKVGEDGLVIEARRESIPNPNYVVDSANWKTSRPTSEYTSACLETRGLHSWMYGRFEVKARFDPSLGMWPAIWFLGVKGQWPKNGEVDLMEYYRHTLLANSAWGNGTWNSIKTPLAAFVSADPSWTSKFHVWRMDWDADYIKMYVDGRLLNTTDLSKTLNPDGTNPFHQPEFMLLNLAVGATGGDPSKSHFPARFEVRYARVYQRSR